jgi:hypothetical protein
MVLTTETGFAQDSDSSMVRIEMADGNIFFGKILSETDTVLILQTEAIGEIELKKNKIKRRDYIDPTRIKNGDYWFENPHSTRYLFATNGLGLKKGEGYYQNTWIFFNNLNFGITDNISLGGGIVPTFLFGVSATPIWVLPKVSIPLANNKLHAAVGGLFGGVIGGGVDSFGAGLAYGVLTYGNRDHNATVGIGFGYGGGEWGRIPIFTISGMTRVKKKLYLISENYFFTSDGGGLGMISAALRWSPENFAVDFGLIRPTEVGGEFIGAPWLGVSIPLGR